jgi:hypothetical protein
MFDEALTFPSGNIRVISASKTSYLPDREVHHHTTFFLNSLGARAVAG